MTKPEEARVTLFGATAYYHVGPPGYKRPGLTSSAHVIEPQSLPAEKVSEIRKDAQRTSNVGSRWALPGQYANS